MLRNTFILAAGCVLISLTSLNTIPSSNSSGSATLRNNGKNPITHEKQALKAKAVSSSFISYSTGITLLREFDGYLDLGEGTDYQGMAFNDDGSRIFLIQSTTDEVVQFDLGFPFLVSSGAIETGRYSVESQETQPTGIAFSNDGSTMFITGSSGDAVYQYSLSSAYDIAGGILYDGSPFEFSAQETNPEEIAFNDDGTIMYIVGDAGISADEINQYDLSNPFNITSGVTHSGVLDLTTYSIDVGAISFNNDGTKLIVSAGSATSSKIVPLELSVAYDVTSTVTENKPPLNVTDGNTDVMGIAFDNDGDELFLLRNTMAISDGDGIASYHLSEAYETRLITLETTFDISSEEAFVEDVTFCPDGSVMFIIGTDGDEINQYSLTTPFDLSSGITHEGIMDVSLEVSVAEGMAFSRDGSTLFIVDGNNLSASVEQYSLTTPFEVTSGVTHDGSYDFSSNEAFASGIAFNGDGTKMYISGNNLSGKVSQFSLSSPFVVTSGVSYDGSLNTDSDDNDPLDLEFNADGTQLFVIGGEHFEVTVYAPTSPYDVTGTTELLGRTSFTSDGESHPRGLAFNSEGTKMFVSGASGGEVKQFKLNRSSLVETSSNDGSVNGEMTISLFGDTFTNAGGTLTQTTDFSIAGIPSGLTPVLSVATNGLYATLSLTGNASAHESSDDVSDLTFTFENSAFTGGDASVITNAINGSSLYSIQFIDSPEIAYMGDGFTESNANDGSVEGSLTAHLKGDTFVNAGDSLDISTHFSIPGIPEGLVAKMAVSDDGTSASLILKENALVHGEAEDIADLEVTFTDIAFTNVAASAITNATNASTGLGLDFNDQPTMIYSKSPDLQEAVQTLSHDITGYKIRFTPNGEIMYVATGVSIKSYTLNVPFQPDDAISGGTVLSAAVYGFTFSHDGEKLYTVDGNSTVSQYSLSTPFDVFTNSLDLTFDISAQTLDAFDIEFNHDGTKMFISGGVKTGTPETLENVIYQYDLSIAYELLVTPTFSASYPLDEDIYLATYWDFNADGTKMYMGGNDGSNSNTIFEFSLDSSFDFSSHLLISKRYLDVTGQAVGGVNFNPERTKMYTISGSNGGDIIELEFNSDAFVEAPKTDGSLRGNIFASISHRDAFVNAGDTLDYSTHYTINSIPAGLEPIMTVGASGAYVSLTLTGNASSHVDDDDINDLEFTFTDAAFKNTGAANVIDAVNAGTGLGIDFQDAPTLTYHMIPDLENLASNGSEFSVANELTEPEGLEFNTDGTRMFVLGTSLQQYDLSISNDITTASASGNTAIDGNGLAFNDKGDKLFVSNGMIIEEYNLASNFDITTATLTSSYDYSGSITYTSTINDITFNDNGDRLFLSVTYDDFTFNGGQLIVFLSASYSLNTNTGPYNSSIGSIATQFSDDGSHVYTLSSSDTTLVMHKSEQDYWVSNNFVSNSLRSQQLATSNATDFVIADRGTRLFLLDKTDASIYEYTFGDAAFVENDKNNGQVPGYIVTHISTEDDFVNPGDTLETPTHYTVDNLPPGLEPLMVTGTSGKKTTLSFNGRANEHQDSNDLSPVIVSYTDMAFENSNTIDVVNSTSANTGLGVDFNTTPVVSYHNAIKLFEQEYIEAHYLTESHVLTSSGIRGVTFNNDGTAFYVAHYDGSTGTMKAYATRSAFEVYDAYTTNESMDLGVIEPTGLAFNNFGDKFFVVDVSGIAKIQEYILSEDFTSPGNELLISGVESEPYGVAFDHTGALLFVGGATGSIHSYSLSTKFDITTATFSTTLDLSGETNSVTGFRFNRDGTKLFVLSDASDQLIEYDLQEPYDLGMATYSGRSASFMIFDGTSTEVMTTLDAPRGLAFSGNGDKIFIANETDSTLIEFPIYAFREPDANDGSLEGSVIIEIRDDFFANQEQELTTPDDYFIENLPEGLTPTILVGVDGKFARLTLQGNAEMHERDDAVDLIISYTDNVFANSLADDVQNASDSSVSGQWIWFDDETNPPEIVSLDPPDDTVGVSIYTNFVIKFNESLLGQNGNVRLKRSSDDSLVATYDFNNINIKQDTETQLYSLFEINNGIILEEMVEHYIEIDQGIVADNKGNEFPGIANKSTWNFTTADITPPTAVLKDISVYLDETGSVTVAASDLDDGSYDNITEPENLVFEFADSMDSASFDCGEIGTNSTIVKVTDEYGLSPFPETRVITVLDTISPIVITKNITIEPETTIFPNWVDSASYENCTILTAELDKDFFTVLDTGENVVTLTHTDQSGNSGSATAIVRVEIPNQTPLISDWVFRINEGLPDSSSVGFINASDPDGDDLVFSIDSGNTDNAFFVVDTTGELLVQNSAALDFDINPIFTLIVWVTDGLKSNSATISIELKENQAPIIENQTFTIDENVAEETSIGTLEASDPDEDELIFQINSGNETGAFQLDSLTGELTVLSSDPLDFETNPSFSLIVMVSDGELSDDATITINLNDVNENTAPVVLDAVFTIDENSEVATTVGSIDASDPEGDDLTFSIQSGNSLGAFEIDQNSGLLIVANSDPLDFETNPTFELVISASDGELSDEGTITINLNDIDETPPIELGVAHKRPRIFPNPVTNKLIIDWIYFQKAYIYHLSGQKMMESFNRELNLSDLSEGTYLLIISDLNGNQHHIKILKK